MNKINNYLSYKYLRLKRFILQKRSNYICKHGIEKEKMAAVNCIFDIMDKEEVIKNEYSR